MVKTSLRYHTASLVYILLHGTLIWACHQVFKHSLRLSQMSLCLDLLLKTGSKFLDKCDVWFLTRHPCKAFVLCAVWNCCVIWTNIWNCLWLKTLKTEAWRHNPARIWPLSNNIHSVFVSSGSLVLTTNLIHLSSSINPRTSILVTTAAPLWSLLTFLWSINCPSQQDLLFSWPLRFIQMILFPIK